LGAAAFFTGSAAFAALVVVVFLVVAFAVVVLLADLAAGIYDSSVIKVIGREALCLKHFHSFMRRDPIVEQKKARSARVDALL